MNRKKKAISALKKIDFKTNHTFGNIYRPAGVNFGGRRRVLAPEDVNASYHVMSRVVGGEFLLENEEKEALKKLVWKMAAFLGLKIYTYCVMGNHFHVLLQAPAKASFTKKFRQQEGEQLPLTKSIRDDDGTERQVVDLAIWEHRLLKHLSTFYAKAYIAKLKAEIQGLRLRGLEQEIDVMLGRYIDRFCSVQHYVKEVKERFSRWFNKKHGRRGTLWMDRYKSVLVEDGEALQTMAAYIDLNPVRAGICDDPSEYRWCGYAEAKGGSKRARAGLCKLMNVAMDSWEKNAFLYRSYLFAQGVEMVDQKGNVKRKGVDKAKLGTVKETENKAQLPSSEADAPTLRMPSPQLTSLIHHGRQQTKGAAQHKIDLLTKMKQFSHGLIFGSREFVQRHRE